MKIRVNYLTTNEKGTMRSVGHIIDAANVTDARAKVTEILNEQLGKDNFRITSAKPW